MRKYMRLMNNAILLILFSFFYFQPILAEELTITRSDSVLQLVDLVSVENEPISKINLEDGLSFDEAYLLALDNSIEIRKVNYDLELAESQFDEASKLRKIKPTDQVPYTDQFGNTTFLTDPNTKLQMTISKEATYYRAKSGVEISRKKLDYEKQTLKHNLIESIINYTKADEAIKLAIENDARAQKFESQVIQQYNKGLVTKTALLDSNISVSQTKMGLEVANMQKEIAKEQLSVLLGIKIDNLNIEKIQYLKNVTSINVINELESLVNFSLLNRMDYLIQLDSTDYQSKVYEIYKDHYTYYGNQKDIIRTQEINYEKEKLNLLGLERNIRSQLLQAVLSYNNSLYQINILEENLERSRESLRIAQLRYDHGLGTTMEVLSAQGNLSEAENKLLEAKYQVVSMKNKVEQVIGSNLENYYSNLKSE